MARGFETKLPPPWLKRIWIKDDEVEDRHLYPFSIPLFRAPGFELTFDNPVTIIVGDNGTGKSTLLESIATLAGFGKIGGSRDHQRFETDPWAESDGGNLAKVMGASWLPKLGAGWFFRAESFFGLANFLEQSAYDSDETGPGFLEHSHGEGFLRFFTERMRAKGLYIFDEPESALSPKRQFEFIAMILTQASEGRMQAIIATHSPILMAMPGAKLLLLDPSGLHEARYQDTPAFRLYREFFIDPAGTIETMIDE